MSAITQSTTAICVLEPTSKSKNSEEKEFIELRKTEIVRCLATWKACYNPSAARAISWNLGKAAHEVINNHLSLAVDGCMNAVKQAQTRKKLISTLQKNKEVLVESAEFVDSITRIKNQEACRLIDDELSRLRDFGPLPSKSKASGPQQCKSPRSDDPLYGMKIFAWERLEEWKKGFDPSPNVLLIWSLSQKSLAAKINRLFSNLLREIRRAPSAVLLAETLVRHRELLMDCVIFVDKTTEANMRRACAILARAAARIW